MSLSRLNDARCYLTAYIAAYQPGVRFKAGDPDRLIRVYLGYARRSLGLYTARYSEVERRRLLMRVLKEATRRTAEGSGTRRRLTAPPEIARLLSSKEAQKLARYYQP